jgi:hypothetical protein
MGRAASPWSPRGYHWHWQWWHTPGMSATCSARMDAGGMCFATMQVLDSALQSSTGLPLPSASVPASLGCTCTARLRAFSRCTHVCWLSELASMHGAGLCMHTARVHAAQAIG